MFCEYVELKWRPTIWVRIRKAWFKVLPWVAIDLPLLTHPLSVTWSLGDQCGTPRRGRRLQSGASALKETPRQSPQEPRLPPRIVLVWKERKAANGTAREDTVVGVGVGTFIFYETVALTWVILSSPSNLAKTGIRNIRTTASVNTKALDAFNQSEGFNPITASICHALQ